MVSRPGLALAGSLMLSLLSPGAMAGPYPALYAFGDSLSDAGNDYILSSGEIPASPPYSDGRFSNGPVWVQDLSQALGLGTLTPSLHGGTDFAYGDAQTGTTPVHTADQLDLPTQLAQFQAAVAHPAPGALYTLWIGSNDLESILEANPTPTQARTDIAAAVGNIVTFVNGLAADGAKNLLVLSVPNLGLTPLVRALGPTAIAGASGLAQAFNGALISALTPLSAAEGLNLSYLNTYSLLDAAVADPAAFGFTNVTDPCLSGTTPCASTEAGQNQYLFWDDQHPTAAGQAIIAADALALVPEPDSFSLFAAMLGGLALVLGARFMRMRYAHKICA